VEVARTRRWRAIGRPCRGRTAAGHGIEDLFGEHTLSAHCLLHLVKVIAPFEHGLQVSQLRGVPCVGETTLPHRLEDGLIQRQGHELADQSVIARAARCEFEGKAHVLEGFISTLFGEERHGPQPQNGDEGLEDAEMFQRCEQVVGIGRELELGTRRRGFAQFPEHGIVTAERCENDLPWCASLRGLRPVGQGSVVVLPEGQIDALAFPP
jgi:hypothetical protein